MTDQQFEVIEVITPTYIEVIQNKDEVRVVEVGIPGPQTILLSPFDIAFSNGVVTWVDLPAVADEFLGIPSGYRVLANLSRASEIRLTLTVKVVGSALARLIMQYSANDGATWVDLGNTNVRVDILGPRRSAWASLPLEARTDQVILRIRGFNGDGLKDPQFATVHAQAR